MGWRIIGAATAAVLALLAVPAAAQPPAAAAAYDGLKVTFCGTSGPLPVKDRAKTCVAIQAGPAMYMVDVGPESTKNMQTWRMPMALRTTSMTL